MWKLEESERSKWDPGLPGLYRSVFVKGGMAKIYFLPQSISKSAFALKYLAHVQLPDKI